MQVLSIVNFFQVLLKEVNDRLFEGSLCRRVPKKDSNLQQTFKTAGVIMAHSVLHGGPGFACLCPAAFNYIIYMDAERALQELPLVTDIPVNASTSGLLSLISAIDQFKSDDEINDVLDKAENMAIINGSNWSPVRPITITTKADLLQELVYSEVIRKRHEPLKAMRKGLDFLGLAALCKKNFGKLQHLFVYREMDTLTCDYVLSLLEFVNPVSSQEVQAAQWLKDYITLRSEEPPGDHLEGKVKANLGDFLQFATGLRKEPPLGFKNKQTVIYLSVGALLPVCTGCFYVVSIPLLPCRDFFFENFDKGVLYSMCHFGQE